MRRNGGRGRWHSKEGLRTGNDSYRVEAVNFNSTRKSLSATGSYSQMGNLPSGIFYQKQDNNDLDVLPISQQ